VWFENRYRNKVALSNASSKQHPDISSVSRQRLLAPSTLHAKRRSISGAWQLGKAGPAELWIWFTDFYSMFAEVLVIFWKSW